MLIELKDVTINLLPHKAEIMAHTPQECRYCHRMTCFFENVRGETRCTACPSLTVETVKGAL